MHTDPWVAAGVHPDILGRHDVRPGNWDPLGVHSGIWGPAGVLGTWGPAGVHPDTWSPAGMHAGTWDPDVYPVLCFDIWGPAGGTFGPDGVRLGASRLLEAIAHSDRLPLSFVSFVWI